MALNATIFKAAVQISDIDRGYYNAHNLTIARHPSETDERLMVRLLAFCLHANEQLSFGKGLSTDDEPDLWEKDLTGAIVSWIDVGLPDEKRIRKASGRANDVFVYAYGTQSARLWWEKTGDALERVRNLTVVRLPQAHELVKLAQRNMQLTFTIQDRHLWLASHEQSVEIALETLKSAGEPQR
jgi:uncharacterized protein YaeQ